MAKARRDCQLLPPAAPCVTGRTLKCRSKRPLTAAALAATGPPAGAAGTAASPKAILTMMQQAFPRFSLHSRSRSAAGGQSIEQCSRRKKTGRKKDKGRAGRKGGEEGRGGRRAVRTGGWVGGGQAGREVFLAKVPNEVLYTRAVSAKSSLREQLGSAARRGRPAHVNFVPSDRPPPRGGRERRRWRCRCTEQSTESSHSGCPCLSSYPRRSTRSTFEAPSTAAIQIVHCTSGWAWG